MDTISLILIFIFSALIAGGLLFLTSILGPKKITKEKEIPFECGNVPVELPRYRFSVKFYLVALLFIIFDIEMVFFYPWAVLFRELGFFGFIEMLIFMGVLVIGFIYAWEKGGLEWQ